jgi:hypothetical protein
LRYDIPRTNLKYANIYNEENLLLYGILHGSAKLVRLLDRGATLPGAAALTHHPGGAFTGSFTNADRISAPAH